MPWEEVIDYLIWGFSYCHRKAIIDNGLNMRKDLKLISSVLEWVDKNTEYYFNYLIASFAGVIFLRVVGYIIEYLYLQLLKRWGSKFIKKL